MFKWRTASTARTGSGAPAGASEGSLPDVQSFSHPHLQVPSPPPAAPALQSQAQDSPSEPNVPAPPSVVFTRRLAVSAALFAIVIAVITYAISTAIQPTFESSAEFRIVVNESGGLSQDALLASNSLTAQLVELLPTDAVLYAPAHQLGLTVSALRSSISVGSVAQENLLQITASGPTARVAQRRASVVATDFMAYMAADGTRLLGSYIHDLSSAIQSTRLTVSKLSGTGHGAVDTALGAQLASNLRSEHTLLDQLTKRAASAVPVIQEVQGASAGSQTAPKPKLYALVALLVSAVVASQVVVALRRRRLAAV